MERRAKINIKEFLIAICCPIGGKLQLKTLFLLIFDPPSSIVDYVFDCLLPCVRKEGLFGINSLPPLEIFHVLFSADIFQNQLFQKILSGIPSECQTDGIQIRLDKILGPDMNPNCLQKLSADNTRR